MSHETKRSSLQNIMSSDGRTSIHGQRVQFLNSLAVLFGCQDLLIQFPNGRRPDVLRLNRARGVLFIGDAKHSESPQCRSTQARLQEYLKWLSVHVRKGGIGVFALCFGRALDAPGWRETVAMLGREIELKFCDDGTEHFASGLIVTWFVAVDSPKAQLRKGQLVSLTDRLEILL